MTREEVLQLSKARIEGNDIGFSASLFEVASSCFNDERLLQSVNFPIEELRDQPLQFFDPFMGRPVKKPMTVAIAAYTGRQLYLIIDCCGEKTVKQTNILTGDSTVDIHGFYACHFFPFLSRD